MNVDMGVSLGHLCEIYSTWLHNISEQLKLALSFNNYSCTSIENSSSDMAAEAYTNTCLHIQLCC